MERALVAEIGTLLFPAPYASGTVKPTVIPGLQGKAYRGWPEATNLETDLAAGIGHVSVFPEPGVRNVTRHPRVPETVNAIVPTITATVAGATVTFGGTGGAGQVVGIALGDVPNLQPYAYRLTALDTPASVAAAFAAPGQIPGATAAGAVLTIPTNLPVLTRVAGDVSTLTEVRRQQQRVRVSCWAPTALQRDAMVKAIDGPLADTPWLTAEEGSAIRLLYFDTFTDDNPSRAKVWRRDLIYLTEFPTTTAQTLPTMLFGVENVSASGGIVVGTFTT